MNKLRDLRFIKVSKAGDWGEGSEIKIFRDDLPFALDALQWICPDILDFGIPQKDEKPIAEVALPGRFSILLDENIISEIVENWKLLGKQYKSYQDVFKPENDSKYIIPALSYLISKVNGEDAELPAWISTVSRDRCCWRRAVLPHFCRPTPMSGHPFSNRLPALKFTVRYQNVSTIAKQRNDGNSICSRPS